MRPVASALAAIPADVRRAMACQIDPATFSAQAGIAPDGWQARLLRSSAPRILVNCSRQSGKSTTLGTLAAHTALYEPDSLVVMIAPSQRQSSELFRKCLAVYRTLDRPVSADSETALALALENGSRIVALPGAHEGSIRGYSGVKLLIVDEASRVPDALYFSVRPMLAVSGGRLLAASTPFGTRGWWCEAWLAAHEGRESWDCYEIPASQCPRIAPDFLAEEQRVMGDWWFSQEYNCQFLDAQSAAFREADIRAAFAEEIETWAL